MCTAISLKSDDGKYFFGRNMDIEYEFGQGIVMMPRGFELLNRVTNEKWKNKFAVMGMGPVMENHPLLADGFNEKGLACAGLNFPGYARYSKEIEENKENMAPYDLILWILGNFETVKEVETKISNVNLVEKPFMEGLPVPPLHFIVYDKQGDSIVIEKTKEKLAVYENKLGVLSNSPSFDWHLTNLNQYAGLSSKVPSESSWRGVNLQAEGQGLGLKGIPGDSYPASRFVRASYMCSHANKVATKEETLATFFRILGNLAFVEGTVITSDGHTDVTLYSSAMNLNDLVYYYNSNKNSQLTAVKMTGLDAKELKVYGYVREQQVNEIN